MDVHQLPVRVREFASHLGGLLARLDQNAGWCAVFWQRDPDGMRACLDGREVPPWDVVEAVLQDFAAEYGTDAAAQEAQRVRPLHAAALAALPGGRDALGDRLDVMHREQRYAAERLADLGRRLAAAGTREQADAVRLDLAWAHDDHERATARCAELRHRMAELDRLPPPTTSPPQTGNVVTNPTAPADDAGRAYDARSGYRAAGPAPGTGVAAYDAGRAAPDDGAGRAYDARSGYRTAGPAPGAGVAAYDSAGAPTAAESARAQSDPVQGYPAAAPTTAPAPAPASVPKQRKRRRGSARFAGLVEEEDAGAGVVPPAAESVVPAPAAAPRRSPRGARFAGAAESVDRVSEPQREPLDPAARREAVEVVRRLVGLRGEGRSGEAHALLVELAYWPAARIPLLAAELQRAGLTADWTTLLWEAASLPADRLVAAADALVAVGRTTDGEQILRQGVARPAAEIGTAVLGLVADGRRREAAALLDAYVRVRTPEEAARSAAPDPRTLVPLLLEAARAVSEERRWDLVHALRVAGFTA
ncbi:hypothetical protein SAMN04487983_100357 [Streptomyces sp. yr375]|uniref:hypothetical protein n=1 Tax=Streptomyces sp. yr375 TaxID=1761906 RepID=UPI0008C72074|nr:hypothetical protein [Streptomyces sp. yr375]SEQ09811.1 hypothetical protein SAMN04487983_100357 [Streptomyces sp. yr375]